MPRTSELKREASRRNGTKSSGPISSEGKARSARNAVTHGITARVSIDEQALPVEIRAIASVIRAASGDDGRPSPLSTEYLAATVRLERARQHSLELLMAIDAADALGLDGILDELERVRRYERRFRGQRDRVIRALLPLLNPSLPE